MEYFPDKYQEKAFVSSVLAKGAPAVFRGVDIGPCKELWDSVYLKEKCGDKKVTIHVSKEEDMDFVSKNFEYRIVDFGEFIQEAGNTEHNFFQVDKNERYYLRSLGKDVRKERAQFFDQFPEIADDLRIPDMYPQENHFSSVFRVSSPGIRLWTHYDTMDNILIQVRGRKRVIFFAPSDAKYLYLQGDKSLVVNPEAVNENLYPEFRHATPITVEIDAGDVLFIPAMWFHNVKSLDFSIAVNAFWYHLPVSQYDPKDTYGNKDPLPVQHATNSLNTVMKHLESLPLNFRAVYGQQIIDKLTSKLERSLDE